MAALVSVILPTFNRGARIGAAVDSVLAQTWRPLELVIVDDGSSDDTPGVLAELRPRIEAAGVSARVIRQDNAGVAAARSRGMAEATGEWLAFLDDDDLWLPEKTARQMELAQQAGADACSGISRISQPDGSIEHVPGPGQQLLQGFCPADNVRGTRHSHVVSLLVSRKAALATGDFDSRLRVAEDLEWIARLCHHATWAALPEVVHLYERNAPGPALTREAGVDAAQRNDENRARMLDLVREKCAGLRGWDESAWRERAGVEYRAFVRHALGARRYRRAIRLYRHGLELSGGAEPLRRLRWRIFKARLKALFAGGD